MDRLVCLIYRLLTDQVPYAPPNTQKDEKEVLEKQTLRKTRKLDRLLKSLPENEIVPPFLARVKASFARYQTEFNEFQILCKNVLGIEVS